MNKTYENGKLVSVELDPGEKLYLIKQNLKMLKEQKNAGSESQSPEKDQ